MASVDTWIDNARMIIGDPSPGKWFVQALGMLAVGIDLLTAMTEERDSLKVDIDVALNDVTRLTEENNHLSRMLDTAVCEMAVYRCSQDARCADWFGEGSDDDALSMCAACWRLALEEEDPTP